MLRDEAERWKNARDRAKAWVFSSMLPFRQTIGRDGSLRSPSRMRELGISDVSLAERPATLN